MPFVQVRNQLAELWHCRPGEIDEERDRDEIGTYLEVKSLEYQYTKHRDGQDRESTIQEDPE